MGRVICYGYRREELQEEEWPELYRGLKGWGGIISSLIEDLFNLGWNGQLYQIKEKFGGLRFYIGGGTDEMLDRIIQAERDSLNACVECGEPGTQANAGWIITLCPTHMPILWRSIELLDTDPDSDSPAV